jgi:flagellar basal body-associated protein FliL
MKKITLSKPVIIAIIIVAALIVGFAIFLPLYLKANAPQRELYAQEKIRLIAYGEEIGSYNLEELLALEGV